MDPYFLSPQSEPILGLKFLADFLKEAVAAIAGAGIGAWFGARFAFKSERERSTSERELADQAAANARELVRTTRGACATRLQPSIRRLRR